MHISVTKDHPIGKVILLVIFHSYATPSLLWEL